VKGKPPMAHLGDGTSRFSHPWVPPLENKGVCHNVALLFTLKRIS